MTIRMPAFNSSYPKVAVQCTADTFLVNQTNKYRSRFSPICKMKLPENEK